MKRCLPLLNDQKTANHSLGEISPHTFQNGCYQKDYKSEMLVKMWRKGNPCATLIEMLIDLFTVENGIASP